MLLRFLLVAKDLQDAESACLRLSPQTSIPIRRQQRGWRCRNCLTASLASGPGPEAVAEGRTARLKICFSASIAADFGPGQEAVAEKSAIGVVHDGKFASLCL